MLLGVVLHAALFLWSGLALAHLLWRARQPSRLSVAALSLNTLSSLGLPVISSPPRH